MGEPELIGDLVAHRARQRPDHDVVRFETERLSYGRLDGIEQTLLRISRLIKKREAHLERAMDDLRLHFEALRGDFHDFFPELIAFVNARKEAEASSLQ